MLSAPEFSTGTFTDGMNLVPGGLGANFNTLLRKVWLNALGMMSVPSGNSPFGYAPGRLKGWGADEVVMESTVLSKCR